jgi:hypothetical protein
MEMDLGEFRRTFDGDEPPKQLSRPLRALWHAARDQWDHAHRLIQTQDDVDSCWIHAHLHRIEGDLPNAAYWYSRAGRGVSKADLQTEWEEIVTALLAKDT